MEHVSVYFIRVKDHLGLIKIGITNNIDKRLENLQTHNGYPLELLYLLPCASRALAVERERRLHSLFAYCKRKGEWFSPSKPIRDLIAHLAIGGQFEEGFQLTSKAAKKHYRKRW